MTARRIARWAIIATVIAAVCCVTWLLLALFGIRDFVMDGLWFVGLLSGALAMLLTVVYGFVKADEEMHAELYGRIIMSAAAGELTEDEATELCAELGRPYPPVAPGERVIRAYYQAQDDNGVWGELIEMETGEDSAKLPDEALDGRPIRVMLTTQWVEL